MTRKRKNHRDELLGSRDEDLPAKFTSAERAAYVWLWDCGIRPWLVDLVTKRVRTPDETFESLVAYRKHIEAANGVRDE